MTIHNELIRLPARADEGDMDIAVGLEDVSVVSVTYRSFLYGQDCISQTSISTSVLQSNPIVLCSVLSTIDKKRGSN